MGYEAKILADSIAVSTGVRLTTLLVTMPRIVLAEFNTHRMLSRNSASSRAIPVEKRIKMVRDDPFVPEAFGKNQKGMQAAEDLSPEATHPITGFTAEQIWRFSAFDACARAQMLAELGVHKQLANRILEPYLWHTVVVTATDWSNFFALRRHKDAAPEIQKPANLMWDAMEASTPREVVDGDWHLPFVEGVDRPELVKGGWSMEEIAKISCARCARVSYLTHEGRRDPMADFKMANEKLAPSGHMSPFEHAATPFIAFDSGNFRGWKQLRKFLPNEDDFGRHLRAAG